jgi:putative FmdB family regulatory protein
MPIYEYKCNQCGYRFEKIQKISDDQEKVCPKCSGNLKKLISSGGFRIKGGGIYKPTSGFD